MAAPTITLRVSPDTDDALSSLSEATGQPVGELVRQAINTMLAGLNEQELLAMLEETRQRRDAALKKVLQQATTGEANRPSI